MVITIRPAVMDYRRENSTREAGTDYRRENSTREAGTDYRRENSTREAGTDYRRERSRSRERHGGFGGRGRFGDSREGLGENRPRDGDGFGGYNRGRDSRDRQPRSSSLPRPRGVYKGAERVTGSRHSKVPLATKLDAGVEAVQDDPRVQGSCKLATVTGGGQNTESFDPRSTMVRPDMRIYVGPKREVLNRSIKHDDVIVVPEFFCEEENWDIYYKLIDEMRELQKAEAKDAEWIPWAEGSHLIVKDPSASETFQMIQSKIAAYFKIEQKSIGTRFNWYRYSDDWKPFHHDSAAFNPKRAANQNVTVGVSFGATRELAFLHAQNKTKVYFPQTNGMLFSFGRDVNIVWKHGINALPEEEQDGKGRISIILWGKVPEVVEEAGSPRMFVHQPAHRR